MIPAAPSAPEPDDPEPVRGNPGVFLGTFLALLAGFFVFAFSSTDLLRFPDRAVGIGVLEGVDAGRRFAIYVLIVAVALGVWVGCRQAGRALQRRFPSWFVGVRARVEGDLCATLSAVGSVALVARVGAGRLDGLVPVTLALVGLGSVIAIGLAGRLHAGRRGARLARQLGAWSTTAPFLLLPWPLAQLGGVLAGRSWPMLLGVGLLIVAIGLAPYCVYRWRSPGRPTAARVRQAFAVGVAPLLFFPLSCPIVNEAQYTLSKRLPLDPRDLALGVFALLALVGAALSWRALRGRLWLRPGRLVARYGFPAIVFGVTWMGVHEHQFTREIDALHDGEHITAIHQLREFDKWPFVDIWPAHGLYDYLGALYALINGFSPFEITAWNGILAAVAATATYAVVASVATPFFAFLLAVLLPIQVIFPLPQYSYFCAEPALLGVGLLARWALARPSPLRHVSLSAAAFLCFFWTPTSGVACIVSVFALLALECMSARDRRVAWRGLGVFALTGAAVLGVYLLVLVACQRPVFDTLRLVLAFIQAETLIGGLPSVIKTFDALAFFQYVALPGVGVLYVGRLICRAIDGRPLDPSDRMLGFLALASLVLFMRTLSRHGLIEQYQPFYFPFLAMSLLLQGGKGAGFRRGAGSISLPGRSRALGLVWFCGAFAAYLVVFPVGSIRRVGLDAFEFHPWKADEPRFTGKPVEYPRLKAFFDANMRPDDTFLELLNEPLLYALTKREVPDAFFLPTMFYATDRVQDIYLERLQAFGADDRVPFALLPGASGRGMVDNIDTTLRSYRIAEYVYRHYVPFGSVDRFEVWVARTRWDEAGRSVAPRPLRWGEPASYRSRSLEPPRRDGDVLVLQPNGRDPGIAGVVQLEGVVLGGLSSHHAVRFSYRANATGKIELFFAYAGSERSTPDSAHLMVRPSEAGQWQTGQIAIPPHAESGLSLIDLRIDPPDGAPFEIKGLELVFGEPQPVTSESFSVGMLPFMWGNFDERLGAGGGIVVESLAVPEPIPTQSFDLSLRADVDKTSGNYLRLCIRLPEGSGRIKALRRWLTVEHAGSWQRVGTLELQYGADPVSRFDFALVRPDPRAPGLPASLVRSFEHECKRYLIRLSTQSAWSRQPVNAIHLDSSVPIILEAADVLKGD